MCNGAGQGTGGGSSWKSFSMACCLCTGHTWDRESKNRMRGESWPSAKRGVKIFYPEVPLEDPERWAWYLSFDKLRVSKWHSPDSHPVRLKSPSFLSQSPRYLHFHSDPVTPANISPADLDEAGGEQSDTTSIYCQQRRAAL